MYCIFLTDLRIVKYKQKERLILLHLSLHKEQEKFASLSQGYIIQVYQLSSVGLCEGPRYLCNQILLVLIITAGAKVTLDSYHQA